MSASWVLMFIFAVLLLQSGGVTAEEIKWCNATTLEVEGKGWVNTSGPFDRLPDEAQAIINTSAWGLSKNSAGISIRFTTNAPMVEVRWDLNNDMLAMPHMPATGVSGVDLYARSAKGVWTFIANGRPTKVEGNDVTFEFPNSFKGTKECLLYLPLYNGIKLLEIGVPQSAKLDKPAPRPANKRQPIAIYGTSITQGGCASRPGMAWTSILSRQLDRPIINLGFSGSGRMDLGIGEIYAQLDPAVYVIDCLANVGDISQKEYDERIGNLVTSIRKAHPKTPIVFVGRTSIRPDMHPTSTSIKQENSVQALKKQGVKYLYLVPANDLIGSDGEGTVDGVHFNDLGMDRMAKELYPVMKKFVK